MKPERIVKIQARIHLLRTLQTTKIDRNVVENSSCWAKKSHILRQKALNPPWEPNSQELVQAPIFLSWRLEYLGL